MREDVWHVGEQGRVPRAERVRERAGHALTLTMFAHSCSVAWRPHDDVRRRSARSSPRVPQKTEDAAATRESEDGEKGEDGEKAECGFCVFMKAGPCGEVFEAWEKVSRAAFRAEQRYSGGICTCAMHAAALRSAALQLLVDVSVCNRVLCARTDAGFAPRVRCATA